MTYTMINKMLLIRPDKVKTETDGGIVLPETAQEKPRWGTIISVADDCNKLLTVNSRVYYKTYGIHDFEAEFVVIHERDIIAIQSD